MEKQKTPTSFHVIYWVMNIITGLFAVVCLAAIAFYVLLWTDVFGNDLILNEGNNTISFNFEQESFYSMADVIVTVNYYA